MSYARDSIPSVILLVDVDCFEVQVWQKKYPATIGKPCLTANEAGMVTSVNYEARHKGVKKRKMSLQQAKNTCPDLQIIKIPNRFGKPETRTPRLASFKIVDKLKEFFGSFQDHAVIRCDSRDEFFIDVTQLVARRLKYNHGAPSKQDLIDLPDRTFMLHHRCRIQKRQETFHYRILQVLAKSPREDHRLELGLVHGAIIANRLIQYLKKETGFQCSAGVGHNMLTAKVSCGLSKPAAITMMPTNAIQRSSRKINISDIPGLGGRKGQVLMESFNIRTMYELSLIPADHLLKIKEIGAQAFLFHYLSLGMDSTRVMEKGMSKEITCGKSFKGRRRMERQGEIYEHLYLLCAEMVERLEEEVDRNSRAPISFRMEIKACRPKGRRDVNLISLFGESFSTDENTNYGKDEIFQKIKTLILDKGVIDERDTQNIVSLNIIAKFPDMEKGNH